MGGKNRRWQIRWLALALATLLATYIVAPMVSEFFIELAREHGAYKQPSAKVAAVMDAVTFPLEYRWFWGVAGLVFGFAIGMWLDVFLRRKRHHEDPEVLSEESLFVGWINVDVQHLEEDSYITLTLIAFNGNPAFLSLREVGGTVDCCRVSGRHR